MQMFALMLLSAPLAAGPGDARVEFRQLEKDYRKAVAEFDTELASLDGAEAAAFEANWSPAPAFVDQFAEKAAAYAGSEDAVQFLVWVVGNDPMPSGSATLPTRATEALNTLIETHAVNEEFGIYLQQAGRGAAYFGKDRPLAVLRQVLATAEDPELLQLARFMRGVARMSDAATDAERDPARKDLVDAQAQYGSDSDTGREIDRFLYELDHLQVGQVAPDIAGADLDGVPFAISDYRGKIVLLDFWGDW